MPLGQNVKNQHSHHNMEKYFGLSDISTLYSQSNWEEVAISFILRHLHVIWLFIYFKWCDNLEIDIGMCFWQWIDGKCVCVAKNFTIMWMEIMTLVRSIRLANISKLSKHRSIVHTCLNSIQTSIYLYIQVIKTIKRILLLSIGISLK